LRMPYYTVMGRQGKLSHPGGCTGFLLGCQGYRQGLLIPPLTPALAA
jgi:hypothetical protein